MLPCSVPVQSHRETLHQTVDLQPSEKIKSASSDRQTGRQTHKCGQTDTQSIDPARQSIFSPARKSGQPADRQADRQAGRQTDT